MNNEIMTHINEAMNNATMLGQLQGLIKAQEIALIESSKLAHNPELFMAAREVYQAIKEECEIRAQKELSKT